jgi:hypothetical protein
MILTGKAAEFAEQFEAINDTLQKQFKLDSTPLNEEEQSNSYLIQRMFELDMKFREALTVFFMVYTRACLDNQIPKVVKALTKLTFDIVLSNMTKESPHD